MDLEGKNSMESENWIKWIFWWLLWHFGLRCKIQMDVRSIIAKFPIDLKEFNCLDPACLNKNERQLICW